MTDQVNKKIDPGVALEVVWRMLTPNSIVIYNQFGQEQCDNPQMVDDVLAKILSVNNWRDLPLYVLGDGLGGQAVAFAVQVSSMDVIARKLRLSWQLPDRCLPQSRHLQMRRCYPGIQEATPHSGIIAVCFRRSALPDHKTGHFQDRKAFQPESSSRKSYSRSAHEYG